MNTQNTPQNTTNTAPVITTTPGASVPVSAPANASSAPRPGTPIQGSLNLDLPLSAAPKSAASIPPKQQVSNPDSKLQSPQNTATKPVAGTPVLTASQVANHPDSKFPHNQTSTPATATKAPAPTVNIPATATVQPAQFPSGSAPVISPDKLARIEATLKASPAPSITGPQPERIATPAAPEKQVAKPTAKAVRVPTPEPAPGYLPNGEPDHSPAGRRARLEAEEEARRLEKEEKEKLKRKPKATKGEYVKKLKELEFEGLSEREAKIAYDLLTDRLVKASLRRSKPVKVLFTAAETGVLKRVARALGIDASVKRPNLARVIRKMCFTGEATIEVLAVYREVEKELNRIGNNINQLMHYLNSKKPAFSEDMHQKFDAELKELRVQLAELERRVSR